MTERMVEVYVNRTDWFMVYYPADIEDCKQFMKETGCDFDEETAMNGIASDNGVSWYVGLGNADKTYCGSMTIQKAQNYIREEREHWYQCCYGRSD